ncbi:MAG TPA: thiol:disulfide interchange protein [Chromatiales bacterium]|nr:thiol:disulfide interchange protein [Chromatiales bacterium]
MQYLRSVLVTVLFTVVLAACGNSEPTQSGSDASTTPVAATTPEPATAEQQAIQNKALSVEESAGEAAADDSTTVIQQAMNTAASTTMPRQTPVEWRYAEGKYFMRLPSAQGTSSAPGTIEVAEVFWYGCPHCYNFDPYIARWQQDLPDDVRFVRIPVMWNPTNAIHARIYYTAEALDILDKAHGAVFDAIHRQGKTLTKEKDIREFFAGLGVSAEDFDKTFRSFSVESKLKRAAELTRKYEISSVPILVIDGKYVTKGPDVKSFDDMLAVADELVLRERENR